MSTPKFEIDWETADHIALNSLQAHRDIVKRDLSNNRKEWLPQDVNYMEQTLEHFNAVIDFYGGE